MQDLAEAVVATMGGFTPAGYSVRIKYDDHYTVVIEAKAVKFNNGMVFLVRSAPRKDQTDKKEWETRVCTSSEAFEFFVMSELDRLGVCFDTHAEIVNPSANDRGPHAEVQLVKKGGWMYPNDFNKQSFTHMVAAMSGVVEPPDSAVFRW